MPVLDREEYIEQAYFFRTLLQRLEDNIPLQEILTGIEEEILATTRLPLAIQVLRGELILKGRMSEVMAQLQHYFTPFQAFVIACCEDDRARFEQRTGLLILEREATYRANSPTPAGLFLYQFECLARNRLGYDRGLLAVSQDPVYPAPWKEWIERVRFQVGVQDFAEMLYLRSEYLIDERQRRTRNPDYRPGFEVLFGHAEGRIAKAHRKKDPLYLFAALQRQLGYPSVPRVKSSDDQHKLHPALENRIQRLEKRLQLLESESRGKLDLSEFYVNPPQFEDEEPTA